MSPSQTSLCTVQKAPAAASGWRLRQVSWGACKPVLYGMVWFNQANALHIIAHAIASGGPPPQLTNSPTWLILGHHVYYFGCHSSLGCPHGMGTSLPCTQPLAPDVPNHFELVLCCRVTQLEASRLEETREEREQFLRQLREEVKRQAAEKNLNLHIPEGER